MSRCGGVVSSVSGVFGIGGVSGFELRWGCDEGATDSDDAGERAEVS